MIFRSGISKLKHLVAKWNHFTLWLSIALLAIPGVSLAQSQPAWYKPWTWGAGVSSAITNVAGDAIGWAAFAISYVMTLIVGLLIGICAYLITVILQLNTHVVNSPMVQTGFSITLSFANLAFVLGIIVIAIMTILRQENYGIKKLLWRLVVAAILVNFGLVIAGVLINLADQITLYFLAAFPGGGNGVDSFTNFANSLAGAFAPHRALLTGSVGPNGSSIQGNTISYQGSSVSMGSSLASLITPLFSVVFTLGMLIVILISFGILVVMFILRYLWLSFLLVLMPIVWVGWAFPSFKKYWDQWWDQFIRWCFFGPAVMFFLYLAVLIAGKLSMNNGAGGAADPAAGLAALGYQSPTNNAFSSILGSGIDTLVGTLLQMIVVVGIAVGGMIAADKMGIKFADTAQKAMGATGKYVQGYVGKRTGRQLTKPLRTEDGRKLTTNLQKPSENRAMRLTGLDFLKRQAGRGLEAAAVRHGEGAVKEYESVAGKYTKDQALNRLSTAGEEERQAILKRASTEEGWANDSRVEKHVTEDKLHEFVEHGNSKTYDTLRDKSGLSLKAAMESTDPDRNDKVAAQVKKLAGLNPELLSSVFVNPEALDKMKKAAVAKGVDAPLIADKAFREEAQKAVITSFPTLSSVNASKLLGEISKGNNLTVFSEATRNTLKDLDDKTRAKLKADFATNDDLMRFIYRGQHRTMLDLKALYNLPAERADDGEAPRPKINPGNGASQTEVENKEAHRQRMQAEAQQVQRDRGQNV